LCRLLDDLQVYWLGKRFFTTVREESTDQTFGTAFLIFYQLMEAMAVGLQVHAAQWR
jgi:hypothetical protein